MTTLEERMRRVGAELDRAADAYATRIDEDAYVAVMPTPRRAPVMVLTAAVVVALVAAFLALRNASDSEDGQITDEPSGLAIAQNLGDEWLWPAEPGNIPAVNAEAITREFAERVLGLSEFTVAPDAIADFLRQGITVHTVILGFPAAEQPTRPGPIAPYPYAMRITTDSLDLTVLTARVPGSDRWVVYEIVPRPIVDPAVLTLTPTGLRVDVPQGTARVDVFVLYVDEARAFQWEVPGPGVLFVDPQRSPLSSALVVFHDQHDRLIGAASVDAETVSEQTEITCRFATGDEQAEVALHAVVGETASTRIGLSVGRIEVFRSDIEPLHVSIRVAISGPEGSEGSSAGSIVRAGTSVLGGSGQGISYTCDATNPASR